MVVRGTVKRIFRPRHQKVLTRPTGCQRQATPPVTGCELMPHPLHHRGK